MRLHSVNLGMIYAAILLLSGPLWGADTKNPGKPGLESATPKIMVDLWTRHEGDYLKDKPERQGPISLELNGLTFNEVTYDDIQYNKSQKYRGLLLSDVVHLYKPWVRGMDLLLLHFKNGMVIPVSRDDILKKGEILIALEIQVDGKWTNGFPKVQVPDTAPEEKQFITFSGNKLVASKKWLTAMEKEGKHQLFNPWRHIDSLVGIEIVDPNAYYNQFRLKGDKQDRYFGRLAFIDRCQFCHAVNGIGARYGIDFTQPTSVVERKKPQELFTHVVSHETKKDSKIRMPHQPDFTEAEAKDMWAWLKAIDKKAMQPYEPFYRVDFSEMKSHK